jgi:hypothetical protein
MPLRGWSGWLRYGLPGLVLGLVFTLILEGRGPSVRAQSTPTIPLPLPASERARSTTPGQTGGDAMGTIAFASPTGNNAQLLTLIDTRTRAFAVYRIDPTNPKGTVKLEAVRQYQWDLKLAEYNNLPPEVAAIESTVKSLGQPNR